jgi:DNA-binding beta-propeller fold protein YncE
MRAAPITAIALMLVAGLAHAESASLTVVAKIPLPHGKGRIDHLAFDPARQHLFVAELGNNTVAVVDVAQHRLERRLSDLATPQGIAYFAATDTIYVASAGDGTVRAFRAADLSPAMNVDVGDDADNVRVDAKANRIYVGFGDGTLEALDPRTLQRLGQIPLKGHPESFQLSSVDNRIFVNVPDSREVAVVDRAAGKQIASWSTGTALANFPMAINNATEELLSVFRQPAKIMAYRISSGAVARVASVCGDADDVFVDAKRGRIYVVCGEGVVDVLTSTTLDRIGRVTTSEGARTGLYSAEADVLFVAARATQGSEAAVWVLKPND